MVQIDAESGRVEAENASAQLKARYRAGNFRTTPTVADLDCDGDGIPEIAFCHLDGRIVCYDGKTGKEEWQVEGLKPNSCYTGGHFVSADIDSDGHDEFLYPLGSNEIIALDHDIPNHVLWRVHLDAEPDTPILADIDNDGLAEVVVVTSDGYLNVLK